MFLHIPQFSPHFSYRSSDFACWHIWTRSFYCLPYLKSNINIKICLREYLSKNSQAKPFVSLHQQLYAAKTTMTLSAEKFRFIFNNFFGTSYRLNQVHVHEIWHVVKHKCKLIREPKSLNVYPLNQKKWNEGKIIFHSNFIY